MKFNIFESNEQKTLQMNLIGQNNIFKDLQKEIENPEIHEITFILLRMRFFRGATFPRQSSLRTQE